MLSKTITNFLLAALLPLVYQYVCAWVSVTYNIVNIVRIISVLYMGYSKAICFALGLKVQKM